MKKFHAQCPIYENTNVGNYIQTEFGLIKKNQFSPGEYLINEKELLIETDNAFLNFFLR